jgi:hypothetical protein
MNPRLRQLNEHLAHFRLLAVADHENYQMKVSRSVQNHLNEQFIIMPGIYEDGKMVPGLLTVVMLPSVCS